MSMLDNNQWRLGHRRPWWQWNVLTLFAALFVLIWARELFGFKEGVYSLALLIFFLWLILPVALPQSLQPTIIHPHSDEDLHAPNTPPFSASNNSTATTSATDH